MHSQDSHCQCVRARGCVSSSAPALASRQHEIADGRPGDGISCRCPERDPDNEFAGEGARDGKQEGITTVRNRSTWIMGELGTRRRKPISLKAWHTLWGGAVLSPPSFA